MKYLTKTSENNIRKKIVILNFILSVTILIYHSNCIKAMSYEYKDIFYYLSNFVTNFGYCAVPTFFALSAFLFYRNFSLSQYILKLKRRFKSLCLPYLIWNLFYCILFVICFYIPIIHNNTNSTTEFNLINNIIGIIMSDYTPLWFVRDLIIYVILSPCIYYLIKNRIIGLIIIIITLSTNLFFINFPYESIEYWLPIYLTGAYIGHHYSEKIMTTIFTGKKNFIVSISIFALSLFALCLIRNSYTFFIYRYVSPLGIWILLDYIINYEKLKTRDAYTYSFFIYANHFFILTALQRVTTNVIDNSTLAYGINYLIIPPLVLYFLITIGKILKHKYSKFYYLTTGGR
jgi:fucose 4-O-acetylase-like acetyltransferase